MMILLAALLLSSPCPEAVAPVAGPVIAGYAPIGDYAGHWGVDFAAEPGSEVGAVADGTVTFAGSVAGRLSVSVDHGRGLMTTVSYLSAVSVRKGELVRAGQKLGESGRAHGTGSVHLSLRIDGEYTDPMVLFSCRVGDISEALRLVPVPG
ncbi:MAG: murein hydrolase activator EnvC family protein [Acidimicrobiia bacterium]